MTEPSTPTSTARASLSEAQQRAVDATEGPVLIIAGPGAGKTHTLVERVVHLIRDCGVAASELLVATFTEKAAAELLTRVSNRLTAAGLPINAHEMYLGTLHSICLRLLDEHREFTRLKRSYTVLDQFDQQYLLYRSIKIYREVEGYGDLIDPQSGRWQQAEELGAWLNQVSEELLDVERLIASEDTRVRALGKLHRRYQQQLAEENALDFASIQLEAHRLLTENPSVLAKLRAQLRYLMVDEYQDTNTIQEAIVVLLAGDRRNLCVVGDDDQSLYRFRGATVRNILEFPSLFPGTNVTRIDLVTNYRSHPEIVAACNRWMDDVDWTGSDGERYRHEKRIRPREDTQFWSGPAVIKALGTGGEEAWHAEIITFLRHLRDAKRLKDWNQVGFLFYSVRADRAAGLANALEQANIPVYAPRSNLYFEREEVQLIVGALVFAFPMFQQALREAWPADANPPEVWDWYERCLSRFLDTANPAARPENAPNKELFDWLRRRARDHVRLSEGQNTDYAFSGLFYQLLQFPLFARYLTTESVGGVVDSRAVRNLAQMSRLLVRFEHLHNVITLGHKWLHRDLAMLGNQYLRFLYDGGISEFEDPAEYAPSGCVPFLTIHQSKGLEFPIVCCDSLHAVPRKQHTELDALLQSSYYRKQPFEPLDRVKIFDFKRLYFTAFSRAQNLLVLTSPMREGKHPIPSKYFRPLVDELPDWRSVAEPLEGITLASIKPVDLKAQYSFTSHITLYENCARQYKFFKELEFVPVRSNSILFGTLVHQTIEDVHRAALKGEAHRITSEQVEIWFNENYRYLTAKERRHLAPGPHRAALEQVQRYVERQKGRWSHLVEAEVDVSLVKDAYILKGSVDLIEGDDDTVEIVDFKSERKPDLDREQERIARYKRQLEVYGHLVEKRLNKRVTRLHLYYTGEPDGNPRVSFPMDPRSVAATIRTFDRTVERIEQGEFQIRERPQKLCSGCDFNAHCDRL